MASTMVDDRLIRKYLLGQLAETEMARLEDQIFGEDDQLKLLQALEAELIEEYLDNQLSQPEQAQFEQLFLTVPERQQKIKLARVLRREAAKSQDSTQINRRDIPQFDEQINEQNSAQNNAQKEQRGWLERLIDLFQWRQPALAFTVLAILTLTIALVWLISENRRLQQQYQRLVVGMDYKGGDGPTSSKLKEELLKEELAIARANNEKLTQELAEAQQQRTELAEALAKAQKKTSSAPGSVPERTPEPEPRTMVFALFAGLTRDNTEQTQLTLPVDIQQVRLKLYLEEVLSAKYRAELQNSDGAIIWQSREQKARAQIVMIDLPAQLLSNGNYRIVLRDADNEKAGTFYFQVQRKN